MARFAPRVRFLGTFIALNCPMRFDVAPPRKKRILIVEDEPDSRDILAQFLGAQYDVVVACDGMEGVEQALKYPPDLIITDVSMPRLGGLAMVQHLRTRVGVRVPVFFLTAL